MKIFNYILMIILAGGMLLNSCMPEEFSLSVPDVTSSDLVENQAFSIEHDSRNPNIIHLTSLMGTKYTPIWSHPQGRSQDHEVTLEMPFPGTYDVVFGVVTPGGIVMGDTVHFTIDDMYAGFISDPMWSAVAGGANQSKTWVLDLDAEGVSRHFQGPVYFFTGSYKWDNLHTPKDFTNDGALSVMKDSLGGAYVEVGYNYLDDYEEYVWDPTHAIEPNLTDGEATWYWLADYPGNTWITNAADFGTMTFDLKGGANVVVDQSAYDPAIGKQEGTYMLDIENHSISFSGVDPLHTSNDHGNMAEATGFRILYLTDDFMQIMVVPSGACLNYISQDYKENWVPEDLPDPEPQLPEGWQDDVSKVVTNTITWKLSDQNPIDWANLDGSLMNGWATPEDYPDWLGTPDPSVYGDFSLTLNSETNAVEYVAPDGTTQEGTYSLDEDGIYTFDGISPSFTIVGWASFGLTADNQLRIMSIEKDAAGNVSGMWVGAKNPDKPEYTAFHLVPEAGSSNGTGGSTPQ